MTVRPHLGLVIKCTLIGGSIGMIIDLILSHSRPVNCSSGPLNMPHPFSSVEMSWIIIPGSGVRSRLAKCVSMSTGRTQFVG